MVGEPADRPAATARRASHGEDPRPPVPWSSRRWRPPCRARPVPRTCTAFASRPNPASRPMAASSRSTLQTVAPAFDGYRSAIWLVPDRRGRAPPGDARRAARPPPAFSPDGRTLAFLSDRRSILEEEPGAPDGRRTAKTQSRSTCLPLDGGEARRLTDLPRGVDGFEWSPDGTRLVVVTPRSARPAPRMTAARGIERRPDRRARRRHPTTGSSIGSTTCSTAPGSPTTGSPHLWLVDVATGRGEPPDRRPGRRPRAGLVAGRPADRVRLEPSSRRRPSGSLGHPRRRRRNARGDSHHPRADVRRSSRRRGCPTAARSPRSGIGFTGGAGAATTSGCSPPTARTRRRRWPQPLGAARPDARVRDEQ